MTLKKAGRGAAYSHGLSRQQEAEAACRLMVDARLSDNVLDSNIVRLLGELGSGDNVMRIPASDAPSVPVLFTYRPPKLLSPKDIDHHINVASLLSSARDSEILDKISIHLLGRSIEEHARALDGLRNANPRIHRLLVGGDADLALDAIRRDNALAPATREEMIEVVRTHVRCWLIRTARHRADQLASFATEPMGSAFAGYTGCKTVGHVLLASCVAPAKLLQRIIAAAHNGLFDGLTPEQTLGRLVELGLVSAKAADPLLMKLKGISYRLGRSGEFAWPASFQPILDRIAAVTFDLSRLTQRDMQDAGFSRMDLNKYRHGLSTSEIISWVALELHQAAHHLDTCIETRLAGLPPPERLGGATSIKQLAYTATILRGDAAGDRHAVDLDRTANEHDPLDPDRNTGARPVDKMRAKLADEALATSLRSKLAIDATVWFRS